MNITQLHFATGPVILIIILAGILFLFFRLVNYFIYRITTERKYLKIIIKNIPFIELLSWIVFLSWSAHYSYHRNPAFSFAVVLLLIAIIYWISHFGLKNLIAGVFFRYQENSSIGDTYISDSYQGKITGFKLFHLQIESGDGKQISIPYEKLTGHVNIFQKPAGSLTFHTFELTLKNHPVLPGEAKAEIKRALVVMPGIATEKMPGVMLIDQDGSNLTFKVSFYAVNREYAVTVEQKIKEKFINQPEIKGNV